MKLKSRHKHQEEDSHSRSSQAFTNRSTCTNTTTVCRYPQQQESKENCASKHICERTSIQNAPILAYHRSLLASYRPSFNTHQQNDNQRHTNNITSTQILLDSRSVSKRHFRQTNILHIEISKSDRKLKTGERSSSHIIDRRGPSSIASQSKDKKSRTNKHLATQISLVSRLIFTHHLQQKISYTDPKIQKESSSQPPVIQTGKIHRDP